MNVESGQYESEQHHNDATDGAASLPFLDKRKKDDPGYTGLERRRGAGRRLSEFGRSAEEGDLTPEQFLFVMAIEEFKRGNQKTYPSWTDVLEVVRLLGYRKTCASELNLRSAPDWNEKPDSPSNVRPRGWERRFGKGDPKDGSGKRDVA